MSDSFREQAAAIGAAFPSLMDELVFSNKEADAPLFHAVGLRYLTRMFAQGALRGETDDPAYPVIVPGASRWMSWGFGNPDACYGYATLSGDYTYRFFGQRGTGRIFDVETYEGHWSDLSTMHHCSGVRHVQLDRNGPYSTTGDFTVSPDGTFEIVVSAEPRQGNWVRIPEGIGTVLIREYFYDWEKEDRTEYYLERLGATFPPPPRTADSLQGNLSRIPEFMSNAGRMLHKGIQVQHYSLAQNSMHIQPQHAGEEERGQDDQLALRDLYFLQGRYACGPDDAIVFETVAPDSDYWVFYLSSHHWEAGDFDCRQTSLNGFQADIDADGVFRAVISQRDPGVPNWLDPAGAPNGLILGRYFTPRSDIAAPQLRVVPFDDLRAALPADTPAVTSEERSDALRRRMHSVRRRLAPGL